MAHEDLIKEGEKALKKDSNLKPEEVEDYYRKKGMDKKEAKEAIEKWKSSQIVEQHKKAQSAASQAKSSQAKSVSTQTEKKSSLGFWIVMLLLIGIIIYMFYAGYLSLDMLKIFNKMNFKFK